MGIRERLQTGASQRLRGLRGLLSDERELSVEQFLVALVRAVREDEREADRSARDVLEAARTRRRRLGLASFGTGPLVGVATRLTDLYCETAIVCDLVALHGLELDDREVAAHMLVLWTIGEDVAHARAIVEGTSGSTIAGIVGDRLAGRVGAHLPERVTPLSAVKALWSARGLVDDARGAAGNGSVGGVVFAGHRTKRLVKQVERQLGVGARG
jgi:hypothetical protein